MSDEDCSEIVAAYSNSKSVALECAKAKFADIFHLTLVND